MISTMCAFQKEQDNENETKRKKRRKKGIKLTRERKEIKSEKLITIRAVQVFYCCSSLFKVFFYSDIMAIDKMYDA